MEDIRKYNIQKWTTTTPAEHSVNDLLNEPSPIESTNNKRPAEVNEIGSSNKNDSIDSMGSGSQKEGSSYQKEGSDSQKKIRYLKRNIKVSKNK